MHVRHFNAYVTVSVNVNANFKVMLQLDVLKVIRPEMLMWSILQVELLAQSPFVRFAGDLL